MTRSFFNCQFWQKQWFLSFGDCRADLIWILTKVQRRDIPQKYRCYEKKNKIKCKKLKMLRWTENQASWECSWGWGNWPRDQWPPVTDSIAASWSELWNVCVSRSDKTTSFVYIKRFDSIPTFTERRWSSSCSAKAPRFFYRGCRSNPSTTGIHSRPHRNHWKWICRLWFEQKSLSIYWITFLTLCLSHVLHLWIYFGPFLCVCYFTLGENFPLLLRLSVTHEEYVK